MYPGKVLWELTDQDDADIGNVIGRPQILKFRINAATASSAVYKYFAVVATGVNNYAKDGYRSTTGKPALFLLDVGKSPTDAWIEDTNYFKISLPTGSSALPTGLTNFTALTAYNGEVSVVYMGDMQGSIWKLDFSNTSLAQLTAPDSGANHNRLSTFKTTAATATAIPFYIAKDGAGNAAVQPFTAAPAVTRGPNGTTIVAVGTGKYLETSDNTVNASTQIQSLYALSDSGTNTIDTPGGNSSIKGRSRLRAATVSTGTPAGKSTTLRLGWYADYPVAGERQVSATGIFGTKLVFGSVIPSNAVTDPCGGGNGHLYYVDVLTGNGSRSFSSVGLLGEPFVLELGADRVGTADATGKRLISRTGQIILQGSQGVKSIAGDGAGGVSTKTVSGGRTGWRQISNYADIHYNATH